MRKRRFRKTFLTTYEQHQHRIGQSFTVVRELTDEERHPDVGAVYRIRFEDGVEIDAWPEEVEEELFITPHGEPVLEQVEPLRVGMAYIRDHPYDPYALYAADGHLLAVMSDNWSPEWAGLARRLVAAFNYCEGIPTGVLMAGRRPRGGRGLQFRIEGLAEQMILEMGDVFYDGDAFRDGVECDRCGKWIPARVWMRKWGDDPQTHVCPCCRAWLGTPNERQQATIRATVVAGLQSVLSIARGELQTALRGDRLVLPFLLSVLEGEGYAPRRYRLETAEGGELQLVAHSAVHAELLGRSRGLEVVRVQALDVVQRS